MRSGSEVMRASRRIEQIGFTDIECERRNVVARVSASGCGETPHLCAIVTLATQEHAAALGRVVGSTTSDAIPQLHEPALEGLMMDQLERDVATDIGGERCPLTQDHGNDGHG